MNASVAPRRIAQGFLAIVLLALLLGVISLWLLKGCQPGRPSC